MRTELRLETGEISEVVRYTDVLEQELFYHELSGSVSDQYLCLIHTTQSVSLRPDFDDQDVQQLVDTAPSRGHSGFHHHGTSHLGL
jgi:hypothetical protein